MVLIWCVIAAVAFGAYAVIQVRLPPLLLLPFFLCIWCVCLFLWWVLIEFNDFVCVYVLYGICTNDKLEDFTYLHHYSKQRISISLSKSNLKPGALFPSSLGLKS